MILSKQDIINSKIWIGNNLPLGRKIVKKLKSFSTGYNPPSDAKVIYICDHFCEFTNREEDNQPNLFRYNPDFKQIYFNEELNEFTDFISNTNIQSKVNSYQIY